jgi:hypothetical protein
VVLALGANVHVRFKVSLPDGLPASRTLYPESLRADTLLFVAVAAGTIELAVLAFKPGHKASAIIATEARFTVQSS